MIRLHRSDQPSPEPDAGALPAPDAVRQAVWVDLESPSAEEMTIVQDALGVMLPTSEDMVEIEASSRVYRDVGISYMTALIVVGMDQNMPADVPVSFILTPQGQLVTVRFSDPLSFRTARQTAARQPVGRNGLTVLLWLLDLVIDRTADILEHMGGEIDRTSGDIFGRNDLAERRRLSPQDLEDLLRQIGRIQYVVNKVHDSLQTLSRISTFLNVAWNSDDNGSAAPSRIDKGSREALRSLGRDVNSLTENATYLMQNVFFLLDAAVGRISIEQNVIIKILSVFSVVFLPPTLIAGVFGMNFAHMPELNATWGYPASLVLMLLAAVLPFLWFRVKGWL